MLCATLLEINTLLLCAISVLLSCGNTELSFCSFHNRTSFSCLTLINLAPCPPMSSAVLSKLQVRQALLFYFGTPVGQICCRQRSMQAITPSGCPLTGRRDTPQRGPWDLEGKLKGLLAKPLSKGAEKCR